jgi:hypothetical protein
MITDKNIEVRLYPAEDGFPWSITIYVEIPGTCFHFNIRRPYDFSFKEWIDFTTGKRGNLCFNRDNGDLTLYNFGGMCELRMKSHGGSGAGKCSMTIPFDCLSSKLQDTLEIAHKRGYDFAREARH